MATGTVQKVYAMGPNPKTGKNSPWAVIFTDGLRASTFDDIGAAVIGSEGKLVEYTTRQNGKYYDLIAFRVIGAGTPATPAAGAQSAGSGSVLQGVDVAGTVIASAVKELTAAIRELTSQLARAPKVNTAGVAPGEPAAAAVAAPPADPVAAAQANLAQHIGSEDAAAAMFDALRRKYAKKPEKLLDAAKELLGAHGVSD